MKLTDLKPNPQNPRRITEEQQERLRKSLITFGDLSGFIFNRVTGHLVGGHQRQKVMPQDADIVINVVHERPSATGTVAEGHITWNGERFNYREVAWDDTMEKAANIAANQHGGEFDYKMLTNWLLELDVANIDLELTGFSEEELEKIMAPVSDEPEEKTPKVEGPVTCPKCGETFIRGAD